MKVGRIGIAGAGTMGAGIAQLACLGGYETSLHDPAPEALAAGQERVRAGLAKGVERGRWGEPEAREASRRLREVTALEDLAGCELVIEAAPEDLGLKRELFRRLGEACGPDAVLATNTSSLSVSAIASAATRPQRVLGMHFFNPPVLMALVEIVAGTETAPQVLEAVTEVAVRMGRTPVRSSDSPGFIVNRCNRPFTLESLRILEEGIATHAQIDRIVRDDGGYRMGPFELMDLIGIDVNLEVARSFYRQRPEPRWQPHPIQERMVAEGRLGRKSGRGFYRYDEDAAAEQPPFPPDDVRHAVLERILSQLVNEACFAAGEGVAAPDDIDAAMKLGLNHPRGPFEWARELGAARVLVVLDGLREGLGEERYRAAPLLRRMAAEGPAAPSGAGERSGS